MANISTVDVTAGVPTAGTGTVYTLNGIIDPTNAPVAVKAASTAAVAADKALVVAVSPNNVVPVSLAAETTKAIGVTRNADGTGNLLTSATRGSERAMSVQIVDGSGAQVTSFGGSGGTASNFGSAFPTPGTAVGFSDGTNMVAGTIKAASTPPVAGDKAIVVAMSPNGQNANLNVDPNTGVTGHFGAPTVPLDYYSNYETVAASQSDQIMGATGAQYDYLAGVLVVPGTVSCGVVSIKDGNGSAISVFAGGGTSALADLKPFVVPLGLYALAATTPGWKITTGANVTAIGIGKFT